MKKYIFLIFCFTGLIGCASYISVVNHVDAENIRINEEAADVNKSIQNLIEPYKMELDDEMNEIIAVAEVDLIKGSPESTMGNWFADLLQKEAEKLEPNVDFSIQNRGGLRIGSIGKGEITKGKIFELMPFDNFLVIMETKGEVVIEFLEHIAKDGGWPTSKNL